MATTEATTTDGTRLPLRDERLLPRTHEALSTRIAEYLPPADVLAWKPTAYELEERQRFQTTRPGDDFALVYYPPEQRMIMVPSWHRLNTQAPSASATVYGTASMETLTLDPVMGQAGTQEEGKVVGANVILLGDRMDRLYDRALPSREVELPVDRSHMAQGIADLMAVLGTHVLVNPDDSVGIGSIRVTVGPGKGAFGKRAVGQVPFATVESYRTKPDFPEAARNGEGIVVAAGTDQRTIPFRGKHASQYGDAPRISVEAKKVGGSDAVLFAEYFAHDPSRTAVLSRIDNPRELDQTMLDLALANGLGAELMAIRQEEDGSQTLLLPPAEGPLDVKRLGGVTAQYIMDHMAPAMGLNTEIAPFCLRDVLEGRITGLFFAGNAARVAAINTVKLHTSDLQVLRDVHISVPDIVTQIAQRFEDEVSGRIAPSDASLVTRLDLQEGAQARTVLEQAYAAFFADTPKRRRG